MTINDYFLSIDSTNWGPNQGGFSNNSTTSSNPGTNNNAYNPGMNTNVNPGMNTNAYNPGMNTNAYNPGMNTNAYNPGMNTNAYNPGMNTNFNPGMNTNACNPGMNNNAMNNNAMNNMAANLAKWSNPYNLTLPSVQFIGGCKRCNGSGCITKNGMTYPCRRCYRKSGYCRVCLGSRYAFLTGQPCTNC
jgi:transcription elongation factor